jgi:DNA mismatch endonuclease (patch repair protein)
MVDIISPEQRSALMGRIRSKDTQPELAVRRLLHSLGYRYVLHDNRLPGRPDLVFPARGKVIFVHGCFWHAHACAMGRKPKANAGFWAAKFERNRARDREVKRTLRRLGWDVLEVFECSIRPDMIAALSKRLVAFLEAPRHG